MNSEKSILLWDNDGVLVDTEHLYYEASRAVLAEHQIELSLERFQNLSLTRGLSVLDLPETENFSGKAKEQLRERRNRVYAEHLEAGVPACPGVRETLEVLHGHLHMAIVTSCRRSHFDLIHQRTDLLPYFDFILTREDYAYSKPHPEPYLTALTHSGAKADATLVIEDSPRGLQSAQAAGLKAVVLTHPLNTHADLSAADWIISGPEQIIPIINQLNLCMQQLPEISSFQETLTRP